MQTKNEQKASSASRKGRFLTETPEKLKVLIDLVNAVPENLGLRFIQDKNTIEIALKDAPDELRSYVLPNELTTEREAQEAIERLREVCIWRDALFSFSFLNLPKQIDEHQGKPYSFGQIPLSISCDEQGFITLKENLFTEVLREKNGETVGIEASRVALCHNCQRIYWKGRKDQTNCSTDCAKVLRNRKWRENMTAEQKQRYKYNRAKKD